MAARIKCLYCGDVLLIDSAGTRHSNGNLYIGECYCEDERHTYLSTRDALGRTVFCRTWRDHHIATPARS